MTTEQLTIKRWLCYTCLEDFISNCLNNDSYLLLQVIKRLVFPLCPFANIINYKIKLKDLLDHIKECHSQLPNFWITCGLNGCPNKYGNFLSFRTHVYQWHAGDPHVYNELVTVPLTAGEINPSINTSGSS